MTSIWYMSNVHSRIEWLIISYWWLVASLVIDDCHWLSLIVIDCHWLSLIVIDCHWLSLIVIDCHWLSLIVIDCHWLSLLLVPWVIENDDSLIYSAWFLSYWQWDKNLSDWNWDVIMIFLWNSGFGLYVLGICINSLIIKNNDKWNTICVI